MDKNLTPPERLEKYLLRTYPALDANIESMLTAKDEMHWPNWCYLPMGASYAIVSNGAEDGIAQRYIANRGLNDLEAMSAIIPWRLHKVIYRFDPDLTAELTAQDTLPGDIPAALLQHMPYPCVYIANPPGVDGCDGVFAFLEWDHRYPQAMELRMHYQFFDDRIVQLFYQYADDHDALASQFAANNASTARKLANEAGVTDEVTINRWQQCVDQLPKHLSLLVYLCSDEPDISRQSDVPRRRGRGVVKTPNWPDKIDVGHYIGSVIRLNRNIQAAPSEPGSGTHASPRPHMRRAHWHLYWTGAGRAVPRVKWIAPVFVRGEGADTPVVTHTVKK